MALCTVQSSSHNGNLQAYLWHIYGLLRRTKDKKSAEQLINILAFTRLLVHHITEHYAPEFWQSLENSPAAPAPGGVGQSKQVSVACRTVVYMSDADVSGLQVMSQYRSASAELCWNCCSTLHTSKPCLKAGTCPAACHTQLKPAHKLLASFHTPQLDLHTIIAQALLQQQLLHQASQAQRTCSQLKPHHIGPPTQHWPAMHSEHSQHTELTTPDRRCACSKRSYVVQLEAVHLLLVLLSSQLYTPLASAPPEAQPLSTAIMRQADLAPSIVQLLLRHYTEGQPLPPGAQVHAPDDGTPSVIRFVTSAAGAGSLAVRLSVF